MARTDLKESISAKSCASKVFSTVATVITAVNPFVYEELVNAFSRPHSAELKLG